MIYGTDWIKKNMGISRKTLLVYEEKGFLKPNRNPVNMKYREYSEEDLERIWYIKQFVELGYSLTEIKHMINNPSFDFRESLDKKIEELEKKKGQLDKLIGHAKFLKATGIIPTVQIMGSTKFEDFKEESYKILNVNADTESAMLFRMIEYLLSKSDAVWNEEDIIQMFEKMISKPESEWNNSDKNQIEELWRSMDIKTLLTLDSFYEELASLSHYDISHPSIQELIKKIYDFERKNFFPEYSDKITPQWYARHRPACFSGSDIAILNERKFGKENCEFIIKAIEYFGNYAE